MLWWGWRWCVSSEVGSKCCCGDGVGVYTTGEGVCAVVGMVLVCVPPGGGSKFCGGDGVGVSPQIGSKCCGGDGVGVYPQGEGVL